MRVQILTSGVGYGGRGKALLSLCDYLSEEFEVVVDSGFLHDPNHKKISYTDLVVHHGISPDIEWRHDGIDDVSQEGDVVIGFDSESNSLLHEFSVPTVAYCRRGICKSADEYWTPSKMAASRHNAWLREHDLDDNCHAIYPVWYLQEPDFIKSFDERKIEVLVHARKAKEVDLSGYRVHYADNHTWDNLTGIYQNSKVLFFPAKTRFEPLGLFPIEAANFGCHLSLPRNAGVSEIYPECVERVPEDAINELLEEDRVSDLSIPQSPTDPRRRLRRLTRRKLSA